MISKRIFYAMIGVLILLIGAIFGGVYLANTQLQKQAKDLHSLKVQSAVLDQEQTSLADAKKSIAKYRSLGEIAKAIVPQDKDQAQTVREIVKLASQSGISPTSITFPASTLGGITSSSGSSSSSSSAASSKQTKLSQLTPVKGMTGVYNLQITIQQDASNPVPYDKLVNFLSRLEQNRRTAQVTSIVLQPSTLDRNKVSFTLTLSEFIKP